MNDSTTHLMMSTGRHQGWSDAVPPAGFEPALPPPESGTQSNTRSALTRANWSGQNAGAQDLGAYWRDGDGSRRATVFEVLTAGRWATDRSGGSGRWSRWGL